MIYRSKYLTENKLVKIRTAGLSTITTNNIGGRISDAGKYSLSLDVDASGSVSIGSIPDSVYQASGSGSFLTTDESSEVWGQETRKTFYLHYNYVEGAVNHEVFDTLVFRNTGTVLDYMNPN